MNVKIEIVLCSEEDNGPAPARRGRPLFGRTSVVSFVVVLLFVLILSFWQEPHQADDEEEEVLRYTSSKSLVVRYNAWSITSRTRKVRWLWGEIGVSSSVLAPPAVCCCRANTTQGEDDNDDVDEADK